MEPFYRESGITIYHARCEEVLPSLDRVDVVITDPPYSEHVHANHMSGKSSNGNYGESKELGFEALSPELRAYCAREFARLAARWVLVFSEIEGCHLWRDDLVFRGLEYIRTGAWVKIAPMPQFSGDRPSAGFEPITICHPKGRKRWNSGGSPAVWRHQIVKGGVGESEPSLMLDLVGDFSDEGEIILDAFMGSGSTLRAAKRLNRNAIGIDDKEENCEKAANSVRLMDRQSSLGFTAKQSKMEFATA